MLPGINNHWNHRNCGNDIIFSQQLGWKGKRTTCIKYRSAIETWIGGTMATQKSMASRSSMGKTSEDKWKHYESIDCRGQQFIWFTHGFITDMIPGSHCIYLLSQEGNVAQDHFCQPMPFVHSIYSAPCDKTNV